MSNMLLGTDANLRACDFVEVIKSWGPNTEKLVGNQYPVFMTHSDDDRVPCDSVEVVTNMNMGKPGDKCRSLSLYVPLDCVRLVPWQRAGDVRYDKIKAECDKHHY